MHSLRWRQVTTWHTLQHCILQRLPHHKLLDVVRQVCGIHAQLMSAAELALYARVENLSSTDVAKTLWQDRILIKTWAMRGTLHLLTASDFPRYIAARRIFAPRRPRSYYQYHGITPDELDAIRESIPKILNSTPITRQELAEAIAQHTGVPGLQHVLLSGWGALLKPSAFQGDICFGPNRGQNVTFVRPADWIGPWQSEDPQQAIVDIARGYLATYGPARPDDFARWWGIQVSQARKVFQWLGDEVELVDIEGWLAWALTSTLEHMTLSDPVHSIRLLPQFDAYTVGLPRDCEPLLSSTHKKRVYRPQGWISAVVLVDGKIVGTWSHEIQRTTLSIQINMFTPLSPAIKRGIQAETERLSTFFDTNLELMYKEV